MRSKWRLVWRARALATGMARMHILIIKVELLNDFLKDVAVPVTRSSHWYIMLPHSLDTASSRLARRTEHLQPFNRPQWRAPS